LARTLPRNPLRIHSLPRIPLHSHSPLRSYRRSRIHPHTFRPLRRLHLVPEGRQGRRVEGQQDLPVQDHQVEGWCGNIAHRDGPVRLNTICLPPARFRGTDPWW